MNTGKTNPLTNSMPAKKISAKIFGVGGAGIAMVGQMRTGGFAGAALAVADADGRSIAASEIEERFHLETKLLRGLGTGGDPERGRKAAEEHLPKLKESCKGMDVVFIVGGLGGGAGTGICPILAQAAHEAGALVLAFVTLPFDYEGNLRQNHARQGLRALKSAADGVVCLPNQTMSKLVDENMSLLEVFRNSTGLVSEGVQGIWRMLMHPGLIEIHFEDLAAMLRDRHAENCVATVEAGGSTRAREAWEKILKHPMLDGGQALTEAETLLVSLLGGPDLTMADVNRVMEQVNRHCEGARVVMGAAINEAFQGRLAVTIIASRPDEPGRLSAHPVKEAEAHGSAEAPDLESQLLETQTTSRPASRIVPPAPELTPEQRKQIIAKQGGGRQTRGRSRMKQAQLPLDIINKGRFDKSEPTIHKGEDLDVPTYIRRGVALN
jgi:cell division protein FtsZ